MELVSLLFQHLTHPHLSGACMELHSCTAGSLSIQKSGPFRGASTCQGGSDRIPSDCHAPVQAEVKDSVTEVHASGHSLGGHRAEVRRPVSDRCTGSQSNSCGLARICNQAHVTPHIRLAALQQ